MRKLSERFKETEEFVFARRIKFIRCSFSRNWTRGKRVTTKERYRQLYFRASGK